MQMCFCLQKCPGRYALFFWEIKVVFTSLGCSMFPYVSLLLTLFGLYALHCLEEVKKVLSIQWLGERRHFFF